MAFQSPMICVPKKSTDDIDWTTPILALIAKSYGENPDNYASECAQLQRCRQDAVRGAGSDETARDLLYKYFGQLELLELRFPEIKVTFPWHDAFTNKLTTQTSIAYEKASILFQIAATHSSIAAAQSRSDPDGTKRAFYYFRSCAGMLTYINDNFLHAPSTDLSRDIVKFLANLILAQATEVFFEKCVEEKKADALKAKVAAQAATMYTILSEEVKESTGKGIFDRNWVLLIQIKSKYFLSLSQYHRALADTSASKHGDAIARLTLSESLAKDAHRLSTSFSPSSSPTLPADAAPSLTGLTKAHSSTVSTLLITASRENDLIYHALIPTPESLPKIDGLSVATPLPIQEVYGAPDVQKTIGPLLFRGLVPMGVHESASVYSEEKAKVVRREVEGVERAQAEIESALESTGVRKGLGRFTAMAEGRVVGGRSGDGEGGDMIPAEVRKAAEDIAQLEREGEGGIESMLAELGKLKERVSAELDGIQRDLDKESHECEVMRMKWEHRWTQEPSGGLVVSKTIRAEVKSHTGALEQAGRSDCQVGELWEEVREDVWILLGARKGLGGGRGLDEVFVEGLKQTEEQGGGKAVSLLDLDVGHEAEDEEEAMRTKIGGFVAEIEERLLRLGKIARERTETLKELKEKIQTDDVSHLLLLNRRNTGIEPALFASELEKFKPYSHRLASLLPIQDSVLTDIRTLYTSLRSLTSPSSSSAHIIRRWDEQDRRKKELTRRFLSAREGYAKVREGLEKGLGFYRELAGIVRRMKGEVGGFIGRRKEERERLGKGLDREKEREEMRPEVKAKPTASGNEVRLQTLSISGRKQGRRSASPPPLPPLPPPAPVGSPQQYNYSVSSLSLPPPPPQPRRRYQHIAQPQHQQQYPPPPIQRQTQSTQYHQRQPNLSSTSSTLLPPPPRPQVQTTFALTPPAPSAPTSATTTDPYASLGMFEGRTAALSNLSDVAHAPHPSNSASVPQQRQQQGGYQSYTSGFYQSPSQQAGYVQGGFPSPPLPPGQQGQVQDGFPPLPGQQEQYGQGQGYQYGGYGYGR